MNDPHRILKRLIPLRDQAEWMELEDDSEPSEISRELQDLADSMKRLPRSAPITQAVSDIEAAVGRIYEYLDTPQGPESQDHQEACVSRLNDAIESLTNYQEREAL